PDSLGALVPKRVHWTQSTAKGLVPHHRHRSRARPRRSNLCAGRQLTLSVRRFVCTGKPADHETDFPTGVRSPARPPGGRISEPAAGYFAVASSSDGLAQGGGTDAGNLQLGLLRTHLLGPADGRRIGRG